MRENSIEKKPNANIIILKNYQRKKNIKKIFNKNNENEK